MNCPKLVLTLLVLFSSNGVQGLDSDQIQLKIVDRSRTMQPGEVVLISATSNQPLKALKGTIFKKTFSFYPSSKSTLWNGLIGIDLDIPSDLYQLNLQGITLDGSPFDQKHNLQVIGKKFPTRRITVKQKYVDPPPETLNRIRQESKKINSEKMTANYYCYKY